MPQAVSPPPHPIIEMNTTPLIDVLLVLLVMLILTIPPATHSVKFDLPTVPTPLHVELRSNLVTIAPDGAIRWNGTRLSLGQLRQELAASRQMAPAPEVRLQPDPQARHGDVDEVLTIIKREQFSRFGFVGNERYLNIF